MRRASRRLRTRSKSCPVLDSRLHQIERAHIRRDGDQYATETVATVPFCKMPSKSLQAFGSSRVMQSAD